MHRAKPTVTAAAARATIGLALAACAFGLPAKTAVGNIIELQLTPAGEFKPSDGRELEVPAWRIDAATAARVIERFTARKTPPVIDYEHQTLNKEANGQPAPAAAFMRELKWRDGMGLYAVVELTERARELIKGGEYRYFSPVFTYSRKSGEVLEILMGALTNNPAIDGMEPLALLAAATFGIAPIPTKEQSTMNPLLTAVLAALGMAATTNEDQAISALSALKPGVDPLTDVRKALSLEDKADIAAVVAACTSLKTAQPDPAKYVPIAALTQVQTQLAVLSTKMQDSEVNEIVEAALADGRLLAGDQEKWARELGMSNLATLTAYLKTAQPIAALGGSQTRGKPPLGSSSTGADPRAVATAAVKYQAEQAAAGIAVSTVEAVDHVTKKLAA